MASPYGVASGLTTHRRTISPSGIRNPNSSSSQQPVIYPDIDPAPTHKSVFQILAALLVLFLALLQLLPATHVRQPAEPLRRWVPLRNPSSSAVTSGHEASGYAKSKDTEDGIIHVVTWMDCMDLRALVVLVNSTLSSTRQNKVQESVGSDFSSEQAAVMNFGQLAPFLIPGVHHFLRKFIYVSPNVILKGKVEGLIGLDLGNYAVAVAQDCTQRPDRYVKAEVVSAIQRSASKPWVSRSLNPKDICMPELSLLLIDARKIEKSFVDAILWWSEVLNLNDRVNPTRPTIALAFHDNFLKLSTSWLIGGSTHDDSNQQMIIHSDAPMTVCSEINSSATVQSGSGHIWRQFLPPMAQQILGV